uniref:Ig-like domain-containing protein n=1 Tax=Myripristis murdjan TaxID=586833 RepID=A0A667WEG8_9TELE
MRHLKQIDFVADVKRLFFHRPLALNLNLTVQPGDNVTLSCQAPDGVDIAAAEWSRTDLKKLEHVFLSVDGHTDSVYQHPSFENRVELKDKEMKNGDLSVSLKNVTEEDSGTYECRFKAAAAKHKKRTVIDDDPISIICLEVVDPGDESQERKLTCFQTNSHMSLMRRTCSLFL